MKTETAKIETRVSSSSHSDIVYIGQTPRAWKCERCGREGLFKTVGEYVTTCACKSSVQDNPVATVGRDPSGRIIRSLKLNYKFRSALPKSEIKITGFNAGNRGITLPFSI
jgi:hypothetical protein